MAATSLDATIARIIEAHAYSLQHVLPTPGESGTAQTLLGLLKKRGN
ncbi:hypothetical protein K2E96_13590 [Pseudomonas sp. ERGC3:05]|nr:hypothetical protein K2E96_13590 [Pseudomonas sp. ERGC3:05]